jgi:adenine-specific DNA-methyltransferase
MNRKINPQKKDKSMVDKLGMQKIRKEIEDAKIENPDREEISDGYQLRFVGKDYAKFITGLPTETMLVPDTEWNEKTENKNSENIFITGDNLDALKHLQNAYERKIKMIYIDPPYNTGSDGFVYEDKFGFSDEDLKVKLGLSDKDVARIRSLDGKCSHSAWLTFMLPRLIIAKKLLADDGVIFISIDDSELANLKLICDEIFGEDNFVAQFTWAAGRKNDSKFVSVSHEYILCFVKNYNYLKERKIEWREKKQGLGEIYKEYENLCKKYKSDYTAISTRLKDWYKSLPKTHPARDHAHYNNVDKNGIYFAADISWPGGGGPKYEVLHPITQKPVKIPARGWMFSSPQRMQEVIADNRVHFGADENAVPCIKSHLRDREFSPPYSVFYQDGRASTKRLRELLGSDVFDNPKDEEIIARLIEFSLTNKDSIVLDFFCGSATTAHAVMQLNANDSNKRKFIMVQLPENLDKKLKKASATEKTTLTNAIKLCDELHVPHELSEIPKERIIRAAAQLNDTSGFRHYKLSKVSDDLILDKIDTFDPAKPDLLADDMITPFSGKALGTGLSATGTQTLMTTWLVDDGYPLTTPIDEIKFGDYIAFSPSGSNRLYLIDPGWDTESTRALLNAIGKNKIAIRTIILYNHSFEFVRLVELKNNLKSVLDDDKKIDIIERF